MLGLGGPPQAFDTSGQWDFVPIVIAIVALVLLKMLFRVRLTPVVILATVLIAPLYRAVADGTGFTPTIAVTLLFAGLASGAHRRAGRRPASPPPDV